VRGAVHQPRGVQHQRVPEQGGHEVGHPQGLAPQVPGHHHGHQEAHDHHGHLVVPGRPPEEEEKKKEEKQEEGEETIVRGE